MSFTFIIGALVAYLLGSIPSGLWIGQTFFQKDIREFGSGNLGSTNAFQRSWSKSRFSCVIL